MIIDKPILKDATTNIKHLSHGANFLFAGDLYIKTSLLDHAVCLETGQDVKFSHQDILIPVDCEPVKYRVQLEIV